MAHQLDVGQVAILLQNLNHPVIKALFGTALAAGGGTLILKQNGVHIAGKKLLDAVYGGNKILAHLMFPELAGYEAPQLPIPVKPAIHPSPNHPTSEIFGQAPVELFSTANYTVHTDIPGLPAVLQDFSNFTNGSDSTMHTVTAPPALPAPHLHLGDQLQAAGGTTLFAGVAGVFAIGTLVRAYTKYRENAQAKVTNAEMIAWLQLELNKAEEKNRLLGPNLQAAQADLTVARVAQDDFTKREKALVQKLLLTSQSNAKIKQQYDQLSAHYENVSEALRDAQYREAKVEKELDELRKLKALRATGDVVHAEQTQEDSACIQEWDGQAKYLVQELQQELSDERDRTKRLQTELDLVKQCSQETKQLFKESEERFKKQKDDLQFELDKLVDDVFVGDDKVAELQIENEQLQAAFKAEKAAQINKDRQYLNRINELEKRLAKSMERHEAEVARTKKVLRNAENPPSREEVRNRNPMPEIQYGPWRNRRAEMFEAYEARERLGRTSADFMDEHGLELRQFADDQVIQLALPCHYPLYEGLQIPKPEANPDLAALSKNGSPVHSMCNYCHGWYVTTNSGTLQAHLSICKAFFKNAVYCLGCNNIFRNNTAFHQQHLPTCDPFASVCHKCHSPYEDAHKHLELCLKNLDKDVCSFCRELPQDCSAPEARQKHYETCRREAKRFRCRHCNQIPQNAFSKEGRNEHYVLCGQKHGVLARKDKMLAASSEPVRRNSP